jgi:hypothetical protein
MSSRIAGGEAFRAGISELRRRESRLWIGPRYAALEVTMISQSTLALMTVAIGVASGCAASTERPATPTLADECQELLIDDVHCVEYVPYASVQGRSSAASLPNAVRRAISTEAERTPPVVRMETVAHAPVPPPNPTMRPPSHPPHHPM